MKGWKWYGQAGHFCAAHSCLFHLHTHVGGVCVSTVGEYFPEGRGRGDLSRMSELSAHPGAFYETMVFPLDATREGLRSNHELEVRRYATRDEANAGHLEVCRRWAKAKETGKEVADRRR